MNKYLLMIVFAMIVSLFINVSSFASNGFSILGNKAQEAYEKGNYQKAIDFLSEMIEIARLKMGDSESTKLNEESWKVIKSWNGNGIKNTESFTIKSDEWRIKWTNKGMLFQIYVYPKDEDAFSFFDMAANTTEPCSDVSYFHKPGEYYLTISAIGNWSVAVEEK
ncbi:hypothetical protein [Atribacter laminatus]|uniref:Uncharacterized protein n=1 Tax=Atribacter laminatus TaxID=2847778 RepID=A0A7T1ANC6_ATRLM|nr:hypothetical protein [Atribacter laminatus]QPM69066.1 hypothetical protein RT761_02294 [Atribacter laminatus]